MLSWKGLVLGIPKMYHVSYVDVGHRTGLDLIESCEWWVGLGINLVNSPFCNHNSSIHIFFHTLHLC